MTVIYNWIRNVVWIAAFMLCSYSITNAECTQAGVGYSCDTLAECQNITPPCNSCPNPLPPSSNMITCSCSKTGIKNYPSQNQINYLLLISATCHSTVRVAEVIDCSYILEAPGCHYSQPCDPTDPCCSNPNDPCCGKPDDLCCKDPKCCNSSDQCCEQMNGNGSNKSQSGGGE